MKGTKGNKDHKLVNATPVLGLQVDRGLFVGLWRGCSDCADACLDAMPEKHGRMD